MFNGHHQEALRKKSVQAKLMVMERLLLVKINTWNVKQQKLRGTLLKFVKKSMPEMIVTVVVSKWSADYKVGTQVYIKLMYVKVYIKKNRPREEFHGDKDGQYLYEHGNELVIHSCRYEDSQSGDEVEENNGDLKEDDDAKYLTTE